MEGDSRPPPVGRALATVGLAVAYYIAAEVGLALGALPGNVAPIWPSSGLAIAALVRYGRWLWPGVTLGALAVNTLHAVPFASAVGMATGNTLGAVLAFWLIRRTIGAGPVFDQVRHVVSFTVAAAGVAPALSATVGTMSLRLGGVIPTSALWETWRVCWLGHALGALVIAPLVLTWTDGWRRPSRTGVAEAAIAVITVTTMSVSVFASAAGLHYLLFPVLALIAFWFGTRGATAASAAIWAIAAYRTAEGRGPFADATTLDALLALDVFLAVVALTGLLLGVLVAERSRDAAALRTANEQLDRRVAQRTQELALEREALLDAQRLARLGSWRWEADQAGLRCSDELYHLLGFEPGSVDLGYRHFLELAHPEDRSMLDDAVQHTLRTGEGFEIEYRLTRTDGEPRWMRGEGQARVDADGRVLAVTGTTQDVTDRHWAELRFQELIEAAPDAIVVIDETGTIQLINRQTELLFGYERAELLGQPLEVLVPASLRARHPRARAGYFAQPETRPMGAGLELSAARKDGSEFPVDISLSPIRSDDGLLVSAAIRDITDRKRAEAAVAHRATHDALTDLPNRTLLNDRLDQALARAGRAGTVVAVLFLDLDRLKVINDSRGHSVGDELLRAVAQRLQEAIRHEDTLARFGGDEFVIVAESAETTELVEALPGRILDALRRPVVLQGVDVVVSASIGVALASAGDSVESLIRDADAAMYRAKELGRDRVTVFDTALREAATDRLDVESGLRRAIEDEEFVLHFQPITGLTSGAVSGVEALVRWRHPTRGLLLPNEFIPIAEETGQIVPVGRLVIHAACQQLARWEQLNPALQSISVSVNLSARQLVRHELPGDIEAALDSAGITPERLVLEITETVLLDDAVGAARALRQLKEIGVRIGVDDFGTGYSSLTYLRQFPVDILKIDRAFIADLGEPGTHRRGRAIVASVIDLAHAFGLTTVAEGVETPEQHEALRLLGCDRGQGYLWSRPMAGPDAAAWLDVHACRPVPSASTDRRRSVLVVDDDASMRALSIATLDGSPDFRVVADAGDGREAIALARLHQPDIVLLDLAMPGIGGLEALPLIQAVSPDSQVVVLSGLEPEAMAAEAIGLGAAAYFLKDRGPLQLESFLRDQFAVSPRP